MSEFKLYVWEEVLTDWTNGLVCVLARNEQEAWKKLKEKDSTAHWVLMGKDSEYGCKTKPREVSKPEAFVVWGGG